MRQLRVAEQAAQRRKRERVQSVRQRAKDDLDSLVAVMMPVPGRGARALRTQMRQAVAFRIELSRWRRGLFRVEQVAVLRHHQEDETVDETQKLVEPGSEVDLARFQLRGEIGVGFEEARAERRKRRLDLSGQAIARGLALAGT